jgi:hypothetical protein
VDPEELAVLEGLVGAGRLQFQRAQLRFKYLARRGAAGRQPGGVAREGELREADRLLELLDDPRPYSRDIDGERILMNC